MSSSSSSSSTPTTRSRTLLFISYRDSRASSSRFKRRVLFNYDDNAPDDGEHDRLIEPEPGHVAIDADLPPQWYVLAHRFATCTSHVVRFALRVDLAAQVEEILVRTQVKGMSV